MSHQNILRNRLDDLFADLEDQASQIKIKEVDVSGWTWECDPDGVFTHCSPEIEGVLGINPEEVIDQDIFSFHLDRESQDALRSIFSNGEFPCEIDLLYKGVNGNYVTVRSHIFPIESIDDRRRGWRGFNNVIQPSPADPSDTTIKRVTKKSDPISRRTTRSLALPSLGVAIEGDSIFTIDRPSTSIGVMSLKKRKTHLENATKETPASIAVPLTHQQESLGLLEIIDDTPDRLWTKDEQLLVEQVADQLALALENARLLQETQTSLSRTEALYNVGQAAIGFENLEDLLQAVVNTIANVVPASRALIAVIDEENEKLTHFYQSAAPPIKVSQNAYQDLMDGLTGWCLTERRPAISPKGSQDARESPEVQRLRNETDTGSIVVVPMAYREQAFGTITIINHLDQPDFNQGDIDLLVAMASQIATALANARLFQEEQKRRRIADTLSETARVVGATLELKDVGERLLEQLKDVIEFDSAILKIIEGNRPREICRSPESGYPEDLSPRQEQSLVKLITTSQVPIVISDTRTDPRWQHSLESETINSWIGAPLVSGGELLGLLFISHREPRMYDDETVAIITAIAAQVSIAIRNANLFRQIQHRSVQLQTAAEISRAASSILETNPLIQQTVDLILNRFNLYYVGLFLIDETGEWAVLHAGTGEAGRIQIERAHKLEIAGNSMIGTCIRTSSPQTPERLTADIPRFVNPLLPDTKTEIALPLISRGQVIGAMSIQSEIEDAFSEDDVAILQTMADQVANALQNAYLFGQTQARAEELIILNELSQTLSRDLHVDAIISNIYLYASRLVDTSTFFIALYDQESNELSFPLATENNKEITIPTRALSGGLTEYVIKDQKPVLIKKSMEDWLNEFGIEVQQKGALPDSWLGVPLAIGNQTLGILCVQNEKAHHFKEQHRDLLIAVANQAAIALQNAQLFSQTQEALAETEALLNITSTASSSFDLNETLTEVLNQVLNSIDAQAGIIAVLITQSDKLDLIAYRLPDQMAQSILEHGLEGSLCDWVYRQAAPLVIDDLTLYSPVDASETIEQGLISYQGVPLEAKGKVLGTLCTFSTRRLSPRENDLALMQAVGQQIGVAIENATLFEQTQEQATELEILNEMSRVLSTLFDIDQIIETIYEYTSKLMDTTYFFVALYNEGEDVITFPFVVEQGEISSIPAMKKRRGLTQHVIDTREPLLIYENVKEKIVELGLEEIVIGSPAESWLGVPIMIGEELLGVIATQNAERPRMFTTHHQELLVSIARQSAIAIQTAGLFEETQKRVHDLTTLSNASQSLASAPLALEEVAFVICQQFSEVVSHKNAVSISIPDPYRSGIMKMIISFSIDKELGIVQDENPEQWSYTLEDYPATAEVFYAQKPVVINASDPSADPQELEYMMKEEVGTLLILPLVIKRETIGIIEMESFREEFHYTREEIRLLTTLANQAAISLENARLYEEQRQTAEQLRELDQLKSQFLANMSHELRTPLNSIIGFSRVIMKGIDGPVTDLQQQDLSAIYNAGQHLLKMINDILDISKIDAGKMELAFEDVSIVDIINSVMSTARGLIKDKPIELYTSIQEDLPIIHADSTRVRQILLNLLSNAAKFTDRGSITVNAEQRFDNDGQAEIYISVQDTGIGIPKDEQEKLFVPFVQVDGSPTRATGGTGLGLSITKMLVDLHNGKIGLASQVGNGSTFFFTLPANKPVPPFVDENTASILAVDDDIQVIQLYERYVKETGYKIIPLTDPALASTYAKEIKPVAITLDVLLPGHNGWKILETLKNNPDTKGIPIIICSILDEKEKGWKMGADDYLVKPILADDFLNSINKISNKFESP